MSPASQREGAETDPSPRRLRCGWACKPGGGEGGSGGSAGKGAAKENVRRKKNRYGTGKWIEIKKCQRGNYKSIEESKSRKYSEGEGERSKGKAKQGMENKEKRKMESKYCHNVSKQTRKTCRAKHSCVSGVLLHRTAAAPRDNSSLQLQTNACSALMSGFDL